MSITITTPGTDRYEIIVSRQCESFTNAELNRVAQGIAAEDMVPVTVDTLRQSYAGMGAYAVSEGEKELVGYARQVKRNMLNVDIDGLGEATVVELGSLWVAPEQRGKGIGQELVRRSSELMKVVGFLPVAVCNGVSRRAFEAVGYEPVAEMVNGQGKQRVIEVDSELPMGISWLHRAVLLSRLREIDRFKSSRLLI